MLATISGSLLLKDYLALLANEIVSEDGKNSPSRNDASKLEYSEAESSPETLDPNLHYEKRCVNHKSARLPGPRDTQGQNGRAIFPDSERRSE